MQDSCYSVTGGHRGWCSAWDTSDYFKWCHMCHLAHSLHSLFLHGQGIACSALWRKQRWYPNGAQPFGRERLNRSALCWGVLTAGQQFQLNNHLRALALEMLIFSLLVVFHWVALSGVLWTRLDVSLTHCCSAVGCCWDRWVQKNSLLSAVQRILCCVVQGEPPHFRTESFPMEALPCSISLSLSCFPFSQCFGWWV